MVDVETASVQEIMVALQDRFSKDCLASANNEGSSATVAFLAACMVGHPHKEGSRVYTAIIGRPGALLGMAQSVYYEMAQDQSAVADHRLIAATIKGFLDARNKP